MLNEELVASLPHLWQVPLPIPLPCPHGEPEHYMPLDMARHVEYTDSYQPSLITKRARRNNTRNPLESRVGRPRKQLHPRAQEIIAQPTNDLVKRHLVRGMVQCKDCCKPRVVYSLTAPSRMVPPTIDGRVPTPEEVDACQVMAKQVLQDACSSSVYVCGANVLDEDNLFAKVFVTQNSLTCADHVEPFFYTATNSARQQLSSKLCCFCALQDAPVDDELAKLFRTVLPVCDQCVSEGALIPVRCAQRNASQLAARAAVQADRQARRANQTESEAGGPSRGRGRA